MSRSRILSLASAILAAHATLPAQGAGQRSSGEAAESAATHHARITVDPSAVIATFDPLTALGSTIDGHSEGSTARIFAPASVTAMKRANFHAISYRLRTELGIEAWHWNPHGRWSDAAHSEGYWTSDATPRAPIHASFGYRLPRRGSTIDQANEDGYSRIDDGDRTTFWKSNPYLDSAYTREPNARHAQWVAIDLGDVFPVNGIRIVWGAPYAARYEVQYWRKHGDGEEPTAPDDNETGDWTTFTAAGALTQGGDATIRLDSAARSIRWIRILMHESSYTSARASHDFRDRAGFAIREIYAGRIGSNGRIADVVKHASNAHDQSTIYASSTDPWHRAADIDRDTEQPGIDAFFASGITRTLPALVPVGSFYDTPDNAAALLAYVRARHYPVPRVEIGEEPDGQFIQPEDFAATYAQTASALRAVDPHVVLGGPSLQNAPTHTMISWRNIEGDDSRAWARGFMSALHATGHDADLRFLSFEWYPFDSVCTRTMPQLVWAPGELRRSLLGLRDEGAGKDVHLLMTEYGFSPFSGQPEVDIAGAIFNTDAVATFLAAGGSETYFYGTEPSELERNEICDSWGNNTLYLPRPGKSRIAPTSTFHAARLLTTRWADSTGGTHSIIAAEVATDSTTFARLGVYALRRPDSTTALLLVNRDSTHSVTADVSGPGSTFSAASDAWQLSSENYLWHAHGAAGYAAPDNPPRHWIAGPHPRLLLPPYSITVLAEESLRH